MNIMRFLLSIFVGTFVYVLLSFSCGESGLWAEMQLNKQKEQLITNINCIQTIHEDLSIHQTALLEDSVVIASYAKNLGFLHEGEKIVKISGIQSRVHTISDIGKKYLKSEIQYVPEWICKSLGFVFFFLVLVIQILKVLSKKTVRKQYNKEIVHETY